MGGRSVSSCLISDPSSERSDTLSVEEDVGMDGETGGPSEMGGGGHG